MVLLLKKNNIDTYTLHYGIFIQVRIIFHSQRLSSFICIFFYIFQNYISCEVSTRLLGKLQKKIYLILFYKSLLSLEKITLQYENIRPDGREFLSFRQVSVNVSSVTQADSSAIFKLGNTTIVCGIKAELCCPKPDAPDCGYLIPNVGLTALCSSKYRPGPPSDQAQAMSKMIDDLLTNSGIVDLKDLCVCKDKLSWALYCDLECIDADGSIFDACVGALMAALSTRMFEPS